MLKQQVITAAICCRLSRDEDGDAESNSIGNQRDILRRYANGDRREGNRALALEFHYRFVGSLTTHDSRSP